MYNFRNNKTERVSIICVHCCLDNETKNKSGVLINSLGNGHEEQLVLVVLKDFCGFMWRRNQHGQNFGHPDFILGWSQLTSLFSHRCLITSKTHQASALPLGQRIASPVPRLCCSQVSTRSLFSCALPKCRSFVFISWSLHLTKRTPVPFSHPSGSVGTVLVGLSLTGHEA